MDTNNFSFTVVLSGIPKTAPLGAYLLVDNWDDWFRFSTLYVLYVFDVSGQPHEIGGVKIGQFQMPQGQRRPNIPDTFVSLDERFFSLGQDDSYYENLNSLGSEIRDLVLGGLRDVVVDEERFARASHEDVTRVSLLRSVSPTSVQGQFRRIALGGARLSRYRFSYTPPVRGDEEPPSFRLTFNVEPESNPPTNIHVLIGRNGVGKTYILNLMTRALVDAGTPASQVGAFQFEDVEQRHPFSVPPERLQPFANIVSVTFSAFDPFEPLPEKESAPSNIHYAYIGLKQLSNGGGENASVPKTPDMLTGEFVRSVGVCIQGARAARWRKALQTLEADPIFKEFEVAALADTGSKDEVPFQERAASLFRAQSSGHKIVLLTITRLIETVEERSLVLLDEPEAHLHPPLLSAFIRSLSELLVNRNGVAIVATHSPVVLQEVPRSCVWKLRRTGVEANAERPEIETFGESVGVLTREVFGLEVTHSGFHELLQASIADQRQFEEVLHHFEDQLGTEARAIVRALIAERDSGKQG